uniref:CSON004837 protein n=1 Tax=Culicoides sonorensis TaxID=179676 RepID=A0A336MVP8_CULSO
MTKLSSAESRFAQQSMRVLNELKSLNYDTGLKKCGALNLARKKDRMTEFRKIKTQSMSKGISCELLSTKDCLNLCPYLDISDLEGGILIPDDCIADSKNITLALAKESKKNGVIFKENCRVHKILVDSKKSSVQSVLTNHGKIECSFFVNAGGLWARQIGLASEIPVRVPVYAVANHILVSTFESNKKFEIPIIRDLDGRIYFRESFGKLFSGGYEKHAKPVFNDNELPGKMDFCILLYRVNVPWTQS